ncbi:adenylate/guanylate cyclase domain-containing protein [Telmatospirillum sp. J64-1]|uniref:adenylate/guanylate cyclase domain-containing protein n=1 Tax=Telmatospirillum sp. J64-1 TaxID=2502183 RepID=UPI00115D8776|nr:adenylate/guanylate cyclase domain-containing protein [Telmatospirillum sp. J64-1]
MSGSVSITYFEVYIAENQRWMLHARFPREQRETAMQEAKVLEHSLDLPVKVVRETYFPRDNRTDEKTVYLSPKLAGRDPFGFGSGPSSYSQKVNKQRDGRFQGLEPASPEVPGFEQFSPGALSKLENEQPRPFFLRESKSAIENVARLVGILLASLVVAAFAAIIVRTALGQMVASGVRLSADLQTTIQVGVFLAVFLVAALPLAMRLLNWALLLTDDAQPASSNGAASSAFAPPPAEGARRPDPMTKERPKSASQGDYALPYDEAMEAAAKQQKAEPPAEDKKPEDKAQAETKPEPKAEEKASEPTPAPKAEEKKKKAAEEKEKKAAEPPELELCRLDLTRFLSGALTAIKAERPQLDAFNKFGLNLILGGAAEMAAERHQLETSWQMALLAEIMEITGTKPSLSRSFCEKYESYLLEPRYVHMIQAGRDAMASLLEDGSDPWRELPAVMEAWNKPSATNQQGGKSIIAIMFTDMVDSTYLTQLHGDAVAQDLIRRHNAIVRAALQDNGGREIKHTGDGIMASFASVTNAVTAAVAIQKAVAEHNEKSPTQPLHLRIGINAGEPIKEDNDLFGSTVQMASRVCAQAGSEEIFCTNVVRELASGGKGAAIRPRGEYELKGFAEKVPLYEVVWDEAALTEKEEAPEGTEAAVEKAE